MNVSATYGVPLKLQTTYDILGFTQYNLSSYSSVFHIMAMRAAAELATAAGDHASAVTFAAAAERGTASLDELQWVEANATVADSGFWAAASDGCTDKQGCTSQHGFFGDALYGQVLAYSAGLGTIVSSEDKLRSHLKAELARNCFHVEGQALKPGCDKAGIVILTGRPKVGVTDWQVWEGGAPNHATVAIRSGEAPATALSNFHASATSWSERINDQWNTAGIKDTDGYPTVTSHYGFHMVSWHIPLAISGQLADLSSPANRSLTFAPTLPAPFSLPLMLPGVLGTVASPKAGSYIVELTVGALSLDLLAVDGHVAPGALVQLRVGEPVSWSA